MKRVLLIADDNLDNVLLIERIMKRSGLDFEFVEAHGGKDALKLAIEKIPEVDGYETVAAMRSIVATKEIPAIVVTAQAIERGLWRRDATNTLLSPLIQCV
ncbi:MAG: hypothetical protein M1469_05830 [Bacteroidetes bacterium]|nr:hypothetical protein [Bacteroidota bacterium]